MKIVELILDEAQEMMGIEAISIVENPAIEENFLALKSDEIKLAEVNKEKRILMGALLVPNKPIFRRNGEDEYYIYFSRDTVAKASQLYLKNGNQNNSTLEHKHELNGLTLVESWIVEDEKYDKSRKYGLDVPVGTWMGAVKVNNDEIWDEYVKSGKVKGFSIEGYFADKVEASKVDKEEEQAKKLLAKIESIVKGEKVELSKISDLKTAYNALVKVKDIMDGNLNKAKKSAVMGDTGVKNFYKIFKDIENVAKELGIPVTDINLQKLDSDVKQFQKDFDKVIKA
jgi:hypothetical protein